MNHDSSNLDSLVEEQEQCKARVEAAKMIAELASLHDEIQTLEKEREELRARITELERVNENGRISRNELRAANAFEIAFLRDKVDELESDNAKQAHLLKSLVPNNEELARLIAKVSKATVRKLQELGKQSAHNEP